MADADTTELFDRLGQAMIERAGVDTIPLHLFSYYEVAPNALSCSLYIVSDNRLSYIPVSRKMSDLMYDLWLTNEYGKRWRGIAVEIVGDRFTVAFDYPDGPYPPDDFSFDVRDDDDDDSLAAEHGAKEDRMIAAVRTRFGDRPILFPSHEEIARQMMLDGATHSVNFDLEPPSSG